MGRSLAYRPEIDGLRALAVLPVIFFHLNPNTFSGGYIGVDVFFVISGFLITSILITEINENKFSLTFFYERRVRRIAPALFTILLVSIPFSFYLMSTGLIWDYWQSLISIIFFSSNFLFALENNYFGIASDFKPFLHTWSLGIEEQFYLFFPLVLLLLTRFSNKKITFFALFIISLLSLCIAIFNENIYFSEKGVLFNRLNSIGWGSFFMPFGRYWELMTGSLIALFIYNREVYKSELLSLLGLISICFSIIYFDEIILYPSIYTIFPVIGTGLLILFCTKESFVGRILSNQILVGIGLISYSLYLWHQPIFTFFRIIFSYTDSIFINALQILLIFILSFLTWKFIEKPFRDINFISKPNLWLTFGISSSLIFIVSLWGLSERGKQIHLNHLSNEISPEYRSLIIDRIEQEQIIKDSILSNDKDFEDNKTKILLIGDSLTLNWQGALDLVSKENKLSVRTLKMDSLCYSNFKFPNKEASRFCQRLLEDFYSSSLIEEADLIILLESFFNIRDALMIDYYIKYLKPINKNLLIVGSAEFFDVSVGSLSLARTLTGGNMSEEETESYFFKDKLAKATNINSFLSNFSSKNNLNYISEYDFYCLETKKCKLISEDFKPYIWDSVHTTPEGKKYVSNRMINFLNNYQ